MASPTCGPCSGAATASAEEDEFSIFGLRTSGMSEAQAEQVKAGETSYPAASKAEEAAACTASHADQSEEGAGRDSQGGGNQPAEAAEAGDARQDAAGKLTAEADAAGGEAGEAAGVAGVEAGPAQPAQEQPQGISEEQAAAMLAKAEAFKAEGNALYGEGKYEDAVIKYEEAIDAAPPGPTAAKQRAVYLANLAACDLQAKRYSEAVRACSAALEEDPTYLKALLRRANAQEELDALDAALLDAKRILELDPGNTWAAKAVKRLEPIVKERHEKLKDEMLGKLKDLGNSLLGKFGLSVDNFKAVKDEKTGGYSISFQQ